MAATSSLMCSVCEKVFSTKGNLNKHEKKHQKDSLAINKNPIGVNFEEALFKCFEGCALSFKTSRDLRDHLIVKHNFDIVEEQFEFETFEDFDLWLQSLEKRDNVRFYKPRGIKRLANGNFEKWVLMCSRSGKRRVIPETLRKRSERSQGSSKYNYGCTSQILVTKEVPSNKCSIVYFSTHYGHDQEIQHLRISKQCRKEVAQKLLLGVSATRVLDSIRDGIAEDLHRDDIVTRKDMNNIKTSYNINIGEGCRHYDDATSVSLWVEEFKESNCSPIL